MVLCLCVQQEAINIIPNIEINNTQQKARYFMLTIVLKNKTLISNLNMSKPELLYRLYRGAADVMPNVMRLSEGPPTVTTSATLDDAIERFRGWCCGLFAPNLDFKTLKLGSDPRPREIYVNFSSDRIDLSDYAKKNEMDERGLKNLITETERQYKQSVKTMQQELRRRAA